MYTVHSNYAGMMASRKNFPLIGNQAGVTFNANTS